jgi:hypothetical protein
MDTPASFTVSPSTTLGVWPKARAAKTIASLIIAALASSGVGRVCGERVGGCVHCARDGHVTDPISTGDVDQRFTCIVTLACFFALVGIELERAAHMHAASLGAGATLTGPRANKLAFKLG